MVALVNKKCRGVDLVALVNILFSVKTDFLQDLMGSSKLFCSWAANKRERERERLLLLFYSSVQVGLKILKRIK